MGREEHGRSTACKKCISEPNLRKHSTSGIPLRAPAPGLHDAAACVLEVLQAPVLELEELLPARAAMPHASFWGGLQWSHAAATCSTFQSSVVTSVLACECFSKPRDCNHNFLMTSAVLMSSTCKACDESGSPNERPRFSIVGVRSFDCCHVVPRSWSSVDTVRTRSFESSSTTAMRS